MAHLPSELLFFKVLLVLLLRFLSLQLADESEKLIYANQFCEVI